MALILTLIKSSWPLILSALGGAWVAWSIQGFRLDDLKHDFAGYKSQVEQQAVEARQSALKQKEQWIKEKEYAEQKAAEREAALRTERDRALAGARRLRDDIATLRTPLPTPSRPPALRQPIPSQPYSTSAKATIEQWQKSLTGMPAMSRP